MASTYKLEVQQKNNLQQAIHACFTDSGIDPNYRDADFNLEDVPVLSEIETRLQNMGKDGGKVLGRLRDLFTYNTFREDFRTTRFEDVIGSSWIIDLSDFNDDKIKTAISQFFLVSANGYFNTQPSTGLLRLGLVFDEAHRVNGLPELENLARQARSYGVALVLASQYPDDLNAETRLCFSTKICHGHGDENEGVKKIKQALNYQGDSKDLSRLDKFEAVIQNAHYDNKLSCTLGWPHYLVCRHIVENGPVEEEEVDNIDGIDPQKLSIKELLNHMREMGLIEIINNQAHLMEGLDFE
ncbi:type IV secretory system conjugative DNA transfer family protein [Verrucomicrobia bacterium]|nr:type IV secretory system conjugative DNA transfer family protein [Verrucomicrobiota bacterium]